MVNYLENPCNGVGSGGDVEGMIGVETRQVVEARDVVALVLYESGDGFFATRRRFQVGRAFRRLSGQNSGVVLAAQ